MVTPRERLAQTKRATINDPVERLYAELKAAGVTLWTDGDALGAGPPEKITPSFAAQIKGFWPELWVLVWLDERPATCACGDEAVRFIRVDGVAVPKCWEHFGRKGGRLESD